MSGITLYTYELDESSYKIRLALSMLGIDWTPVAINVFPANEPATLEMLAMNPTGRVPTLKDGDFLLFGTEAILAYLANAYDTGGQWLPKEPKAFGTVMQWLNFSATDLAATITARQASIFDAPGDEKTLRAACLKVLQIMEDHMLKQGFLGKGWFAGDTATLADIALFPAFALSRDFGIDHDEYPALRQWARRFRTLSSFKTMPGIPDYH